MLHNAVARADSYFKFPQINLSPSCPLLPSPAVCRCRVVMCCKLGEGLLFSLKPQALCGNWLVWCVCVCVCVCLVHNNGCVYIGFGVHMFIHACTLTRKCRLCFLLSRERGVGFLSLGIIDTSLQSCCLVLSTDPNTQSYWLLHTLQATSSIFCLSAHFREFVFSPVTSVQSA